MDFLEKKTCKKRSKTKKLNITTKIFHTEISLSTKFQPKLIILIFGPKFVQKVYFRWKIQNVDITIEFCIFESV